FARLDLAKYKGLVPVELFGRTKFPAIEEQPYLITLGGHAFYWFSLERARTSELDARVARYHPPSLDVAEDWEPTLHGDERSRLEELMPAWLETRRWFESGGRILTGARITEAVPIEADGAIDGAFDLLVVQAEFATGAPVRYLVPLAVAKGEH